MNTEIKNAEKYFEDNATSDLGYRYLTKKDFLVFASQFKSEPIKSNEGNVWVQWIVNDNAELGVKVGDKYFWLYKGESLEYKNNEHDDGTRIKFRQVGKREFGECCYPVHLKSIPYKYTEGEGWQDCITPIKSNDVGEAAEKQKSNTIDEDELWEDVLNIAYLSIEFKTAHTIQKLKKQFSISRKQ